MDDCALSRCHVDLLPSSLILSLNDRCTPGEMTVTDFESDETPFESTTGRGLSNEYRL